MIETVVAKSRKPPRGYSKIGDDVAVVPLGRGKAVLKTDMLVEHTDMPRGMTYRQAARKAVAMCVSDFAAKGAEPDSFMVSLGLKRGTPQRLVDEIGSGLGDAEERWGVHLVGGDTGESKELVIDCAMLGFAERVVPRGGASPGDVLVVSGWFGYPPSGLRLLEGGARSEPAFRRLAIKSALEPDPDLRVGLALSPFLTSSMDSSDGLARSLHTLANQSSVGFEVDRLPVGDGVAAFAESNGLDVERLVLEGGEEYLIVGTVRKSDLKRAARAVSSAGGELLAIGSAGSAHGVVMKKGSSEVPVRDEGWTHLR